MKANVRLKHSMLTILGLIVSILVVASFIFMATKFNPEKTKEYADQFFKTNFPNYTVRIDDVSVRIGLVAAIGFKNVQMTPIDAQSSFVTARKVQIKTSLSSIIFKKKPIDVFFEDVNINSNYARNFIHGYLIKEPFSVEGFNLPEFVKISGINFKIRNVVIDLQNSQYQIDKATLKARANSLWAYEIEGNHSIGEGPSLIKLKHITVGEIHFFEKASQITFLSQTNEASFDSGLPTLKDFKIQGALDIPTVGDMTASMNFTFSDTGALNLTWFEGDDENIREISGKLDTNYIKLLRLYEPVNKFKNGVFEFSKGPNYVRLKKVDSKAMTFSSTNISSFLYEKNENKITLRSEFQLNDSQNGLDIFESEKTFRLNLKLENLREIVSTSFQDFLKINLDSFNLMAPQSSMIFEFSKCTNNEIGCRVEFKKDKLTNFSGHLTDQNSQRLGKINLNYIAQEEFWDLEINAIDFSLMNIDFPIEAKCDIRWSLRKPSNDLEMECSRGEFTSPFSSPGTPQSKISFKKLKLILNKNQYLLEVSPLKGRQLKLSGNLERFDDKLVFFLNESKDMSFTLLKTSQGFKISN
ncbi:MAG: hypothetical protein OHK0056_15640 [Bacteriovoracaceae bacterium]